MDNIKIKGEVFIEKVDINTNKVYETIGPVLNDVSWQGISLLLMPRNLYTSIMPITRPVSGTPTAKWMLAWSSYEVNQDISNWSIPIGTAGAETLGSAIDMEVGYPLFTAKTLPNEKDFVTFVAVLNPIAGGRTIKSLGLQASNIGGTNETVSDNSQYNTFTNLNLTTPCIQGESTQLQIKYRLYLDDVIPSASISNISNGYYSYLRDLFKVMSNGTYSGIVPITLENALENIGSSFYDYNNITNLGPYLIPNPSPSLMSKTTDFGIGKTNVTSQWNAYESVWRRLSNTFILTDINSMGTFFRTLMVGSSGATPITSSSYSKLPFIYQRSIEASASPITNVFKQTSAAIGPFQNINSISPMTGNLTFNTSGYTAQPFPKLVRLKITSDGDSSTATYKFETLDFTGGFVQNSFCPREALIPQDGRNIQDYSYHRKDPNEKIIIDYVSQGGTSIRNLNTTDTFVAVSCLRTQDAISIYNIATGNKITLSANTTPSLPVTNTSDVAISNGYIFVTCSATGLWQINPTLTTITHLTSIGVGIDSSKAYQIDVKSNGDLWVLFDGGLAQGITTDSGATWAWTVYNHTSSTIFNAVGITDNKWSNVTSMVIDKDHANNRILFVSGTVSTSNSNASSFIWWEGSTGTTTIQTTGIPYVGFSTSINLKRSDVMHCVNGYWLASSANVDGSGSFNQPLYKAQFGDLSWTTNTTTTPMYISARAIPATVAGVSGLFYGSNSPAGISNITRTSAFFVQGSNISALPATINSSTPQIEFFNKFGTVETTVADFRTYQETYFMGSGYAPVLYFSDSNMVVYYYYPTNTFTVAPLVIDPSATNYNTFKTACWKEYEWDGANWVLGNTNSKTCHTTSEVLVDGISIAFNDGVSGPHFLNTHQFVFVIGNGIMKDNATTYTYNLSVSPNETEIISDFYTAIGGQVTTVPSYRYGIMTDEYVNFSKRDSELVGDKGVIQTRGRISGREKVSSAFRIADQTIPANTPFTFKFKLITPSPAYGLNVSAFSIQLLNSSNSVQLYCDRDNVGNFAIKNSGGTVIGYIPKVNLNTTTDIIIERGNDNKIYFYYGSTLIYTHTTLGIQLHIGVNANTNDSLAQSVIGYYDMRLTYHELRRLVKVGNLSNSTGHFNPKFMGLTPSVAPNNAKITVNNIPRTIVNKASLDAISGVEVKVATGCGYIVFEDLPSITYPSTGSPTTGPCLATVVSGGVVTSIDIINTGSGFSTTPTLAISAPLSGVTATATATLTASKSVNDLVTITNAGVGYTDGTYTLVFSGGGGANAAGTVVISGGIVRRVNISNGGDSYTTAPTLSFTGAGSPTTAAVLTAAIGYRIASIAVTNGGSGYIPDGNTSLVGYATAHYLP